MTVSLSRHTSRAAVRQAPGPRPARTPAALLVLVAAVAALAASVLGLLGDPYGEPSSTGAMLRGYDAINALVALALIALVPPARRGSQPAVLTQAALLAYLVYTYAYYVFATSFNDLFLLHIVGFSASLTGLWATAREVETGHVAELLPSSRRLRLAAGVLALLAVALGGMWLFAGIDNALGGDVPAGSRLVETAAVVHLGIALDLAILVPWYATAAVLLWLRRAAGYAAAVVALGSGLLHQLSYLVALPAQVAAEVPGASSFDPGEPVIVMLYAAGLGLLLTRRRNATDGR